MKLEDAILESIRQYHDEDFDVEETRKLKPKKYNKKYFKDFEENLKEQKNGQ